jgi:hypothetical protein
MVVGSGWGYILLIFYYLLPTTYYLLPITYKTRLY